MFNENPGKKKINLFSGIYNIDRFYLPKNKKNLPPSKPSQEQNVDGNIGQSSEKRVRIEVVDDIISNPSLHKDINEYEPGTLKENMSI